MEMIEMWEKFKFWILGNKDCAGCCLGCSFYEECSSEVLYEKDSREAYERDVLIDTIIKERMKERVPDHRKSA